MHYEVRLGYKTGRPLSKTQRTSGTFAEEPVVLGKVLRRGEKPRLLTEAQFSRFKPQLLRLLLSGSVEIYVVDADQQPVRLDYRSARMQKPSVEGVSGDAAQQPSGPASQEAEDEELEADEPPSSTDGGEAGQDEEPDPTPEDSEPEA